MVCNAEVATLFQATNVAQRQTIGHAGTRHPR